MAQQVILDTICRTCKGMIDEQHIEPPYHQWEFIHHSFEDLQQSAWQGCHLCNLVLDQLDLERWSKFFTSPEIALRSKRRPLTFSVYRKEYHDPFKSRSEEDTLEILPTEDVEIIVRAPDLGLAKELTPCIAILGAQFHQNADAECVGRPSNNNTSSQESSQKIKTWLAGCLASHSECQPNIAVELPSRLVELVGNEPALSLRLRETGDLNGGVPYVTLSYCWGSAQFVKLHSHNYADFKKSIPVDVLPKTFRDAVHVTCQLGQRFIWIDALCIIQDDPADWRRESASMGRIYSGGFVNITASASIDVEGGLFRQRSVLRITPCLTRPKWRGFDDDVLVWFNVESYWRKVYASPVSKRAWCLQERLLASRTIHFTENQLYWECNTVVTSEADPIPLPRKSGGSGDDLRRTALLPHLQTSRRYTDPKWIPTKTEMLNTAWSRLVGAYTQAKLTVKTDKLVAISGLGRKVDEVHAHAGRRYLAGLWEASLPVELLWRVIDPVSASPTRHTCLVAPSWSWASVDGAIDLPMTNRYRGTTIRASIVEATTTPLDDPFGAVSGGHIRIRGPLWEVHVRETAPKRASPEDYNLEPDSSADIEINSFLIADCQICWDDRSSSARARYLANPLYLLAITEDVNPGSTPTVCHRIVGLLLMPTWVGRGQYLRVGWVSLAQNLEPDRHKILLNALRSAKLPMERYEDFDAHDQYTIEIQ